jgi:hypothetical protein
MSHLRINLILVSAILLLLPGVFGLDFSMGIFDGINGASEILNLNAGVNNALASRTVASPGYYSTNMNIAGPGILDFDQSFNSLDNGEHVRLIAKMSNSVHHDLNYIIEKQTDSEIRASESLTVDQGINIECSAQAWNSLGQSAKVGLKIPAGSLTSYSNYGDAMDGSATAFQTAVVPKGTKFNVFAEAKRGFSAQSTSSTLLSLQALNATTTTSVSATKTKTISIIRPA